MGHHLENIFVGIIGKKVRRLILIAWPPFGESSTSQIDLSIGLVFDNKPNTLLVISTDKNDLTTPFVERKPIREKYFEWSEFHSRMKRWMDGEEGMEMDNEYYDVSEVGLFQMIVNQNVQDVELVNVANDSPIGVKLIFDNDYILSTPIIDGNTIETSSFNTHENLKNLASLGAVEYVSLKQRDQLGK